MSNNKTVLMAAALAMIGSMPAMSYNESQRRPEPESREHREYRKERRERIKAERKARKKNRK